PGTLARHGRALRMWGPDQAIPREAVRPGQPPIAGFDTNAGACARNGLTFRDSGLRRSRGPSGPGHARRSLAREPPQLVARPPFPVAARRQGTRSQPPATGHAAEPAPDRPCSKSMADAPEAPRPNPGATTPATDRGARADWLTHRPCPRGMPAPISPWSRG